MSNLRKARLEFMALTNILVGGNLSPKQTAIAMWDIINTHLPRKTANYRSRGQRAKCTPALRQQITKWAASHPTWDNQRIAEKFNVTNARVSETLNP